MLASKDLLFHKAPCMACRIVHVVGVGRDRVFTFVNTDMEETSRTTQVFSGDTGVLKLMCPDCGKPEIVLQIDSAVIFLAGKIFERTGAFGPADRLN